MNLLRIYNQNRKKIWYGIAVIGIVFLLTTTMKKQGEEELKNRQKSEQTYSEKEYKENPDIKVTISDNQVESNKELIIDQFIRYCNNGEIEQAYSLLSDNCKKNVYPNIESFREKYINKLYNTTKLYKKEKYNYPTYKVYLYEDMLSTGKVTRSAIEDYFTIEKNDNEVKLNISGYIKTEEINKSEDNGIISINVKKRIVYIDHEDYELEVKNYASKSILLDGKYKTNTVFIEDVNGAKNFAMLNEKSLSDLEIFGGAKVNITIPIFRTYNNDYTIKTMTFSDIILDENVYEESDKSTFIMKSEITVKL